MEKFLLSHHSMSFYLDSQIRSDVNIFPQVNCRVSQCGCGGRSCSVQFLFGCAFFWVFILRFFSWLGLAFLLASFLCRHHIVLNVCQNISFWLACFVIFMQDAFGRFYFGGLRILVNVRKVFSLFCDGFFDKVRVFLLHIFKLNQKRFFVFV